MRLTLVFAVSAALFWGGTAVTNAQAAAGCQPVHIVNRAGIGPRAVAQDERAVTAQSYVVASAWHVAPVCFGSAGWPLLLQWRSWTTVHAQTPTGQDISMACTRAMAGCHGAAYATGKYYPLLIVGRYGGGWRITLSHEVIEALVDPIGSGRPEIADRYEAYAYRLDGVLVSNWMLPSRRPYAPLR